MRFCSSLEGNVEFEKGNVLCMELYEYRGVFEKMKLGFSMKKSFVLALVISVFMMFATPMVAEASAPNGVNAYTVKAGDSLWKIAEEVYGYGSMYQRIYEINKDIIKDPALIFPGQHLKLNAERIVHDITVVNGSYRANENLNIGDAYHILNGKFTIDADPSVAYIDENGNIVAVSPGRFKIETEDGRAEYLYVWAEWSHMIFVSDEGRSQIIEEAGTTAADAVSSDISVATVSVKEGFVFIKPLKPGLVTVTVTDKNNIKKDCYFTVIDF